MTEKHIRIDMDYVSTPVWFSEDGNNFVNGDIESLELNSEIVQSLNYYEKVWYKIDSNPDTKIEDPYLGSYDNLYDYVKDIAFKIKDSLPEKHIYIWNEEDMNNEII